MAANTEAVMVNHADALSNKADAEREAGDNKATRSTWRDKKQPLAGGCWIRRRPDFRPVSMAVE